MRNLCERAVAVAFVFAICAGAWAKEQEHHDHSAVMKHVLPDKEDMAWAKVPWLPTLWDAVVEAHRAKKPILLWAMNGHALACT